MRFLFRPLDTPDWDCEPVKASSVICEAVGVDISFNPRLSLRCVLSQGPGLVCNPA